MKKNIYAFAFILLLSGISAFAGEYFSFPDVADLTPEQEEKLAGIRADYEKKYKDIENDISDFGLKIEKIKSDDDKNPEQISLLTGAYERNIKLLKYRRNQFRAEEDEAYRSVLNDEQYKQYKSIKNE